LYEGTCCSKRKNFRQGKNVDFFFFLSLYIFILYILIAQTTTIPMQPPAVTPPPVSLQKLWLAAAAAFILLLIGRASFTKDYKAEVEDYLKSVGRSDLIVVTEADKQKKSVSLSDEVKWTRKDIDAILNKLDMASVAPSGAS
jgi:hypothetical protein